MSTLISLCLCLCLRLLSSTGQLEFDIVFENSESELVNLTFSSDSAPINMHKFAVIDFRALFYIQRLNLRVEHLPEGDNRSAAEAYAKYFERNRMLQKVCKVTSLSPNETELECDSLGRVVAIRTSTDLLSLTVVGYDTLYERLLGCYQVPDDKRVEDGTHRLISVDDCLRRCSGAEASNFAAVRYIDLECLCLESMDSVLLEELSSCHITCPNFPYQICGGHHFHSVYTIGKVNLRRQTEATWQCIRDEENCVRCVPGRKGYNCDAFDCLVDNGSCGNKICQTYDVNGMKREICACPRNTTFVEDGKCKEFRSDKGCFVCIGAKTILLLLILATIICLLLLIRKYNKLIEEFLSERLSLSGLSFKSQN